MKQRQLGKNGPNVGAIALGCMNFAGFYGPTDEAESHRALASAYEMGITHLDTALIYGQGLSEEIIGRFLKENPSCNFSIATKGAIRTQPTREFDSSPEFLRECLEGSLRRLGVDCVDLYYIHRRDPRIEIEEVTHTLAGFIREGKIKAFGFSEISPSTLERASKVHHVGAVQSEYSLWTRQPELGVIQACKRLGTAFVAFSPLARGMFAHQSANPELFDKQDFRQGNPRFVEPNYSNNLKYFDAFRALSDEMGQSPAALAIAWVLHQGEHIIPIPGTRSESHLREWARAGDITLDKAALGAIDQVMPAGFAHGARYSEAQSIGPEVYC